MKNFVLFSIFIVILMATFAIRGFAQVAINTGGSAPNSSAMLDVSSLTKGFLVPRMSTADRSAVPSPSEGLLVYDTDTHSFWFFKSGAWSESLGTSNGWSVAGNSLTGSEFLGSTNSQPVKFFSNDEERMRVDENGNVGIGTTAPSAKLDVRGQNLGYAKILWPASGPDDFDIIDFSTPDKPGIFGGDAGFFMNPEEGIHLVKGSTEIQITQADMLFTTPTAEIILANNGNLGINTGIPLPTNLLHVNATADPLRLEGLQANTTDNDVLVSTSTGVIQKRTLTSLVGGSAWSLGGNALTGTEFLGSSNFQPVKLYTNNSERMRIDEDGNIGIGTASPQSPLHVIQPSHLSNEFEIIRMERKWSGGTHAAKSSFVFYDGNYDDVQVKYGQIMFDVTNIDVGKEAATLRFWTRDNGVLANTMTLAGDGKVGIGTVTPLNQLHVFATSDPLLLEGLEANTKDNEVLVSTSAGVIQKRTMASLVGESSWSLSGNALTGTEFLGSANSQPVKFYSDNSERMRIDENGNIGIGTTTPSSFIDLHKGFSPVLKFTGGPAPSDGPSIALYNGSNLRLTLSGQGIIPGVIFASNGQVTANDYLSLNADGTSSQLYLENGGNVGIGMNNPKEKLDVVGNGNFSGAVTATTINASQIVHLTPLASAPSSPAKGDMYFDDTANKLRVWNGSAWMDCW